MVVSDLLSWRKVLVPAILLMWGCTGPQLRFRTTVAKQGPGAGGWQEACLEARIENMTTRDAQICVVGVGMPVETTMEGFIAPWQAEEITLECVGRAAELAIQPAPPEVPAAVACTHFRDTLRQLLSQKVSASRVKSACENDVPRTRFGF